MSNRVKPTEKQAKAMSLIRDGVLPTLAMKEAGYSENSSQAPSANLLRSAGVQSILEQYKAAYLKVGITPEFMAEKTKEWLKAAKIHTSHTEPDRVVPDYDTQLKAAELVRKDWALGSDTNIKKRIVAEEFFGGEE